LKIIEELQQESTGASGVASVWLRGMKSAIDVVVGGIFLEEPIANCISHGHSVDCEVGPCSVRDTRAVSPTRMDKGAIPCIIVCWRSLKQLQELVMEAIGLSDLFTCAGLWSLLCTCLEALNFSSKNVGHLP